GLGSADHAGTRLPIASSRAQRTGLRLLHVIETAVHRDDPPGPAANASSQPGWVDDPLWYKDAIVYEVHVRAFYDSNNDGVGDLAGLAQKLDYIQDLGVNTVWLLPFYPSPMKDDGYDIADYHNIHPQYGTRNDLRHVVREAHRRGLKVITEL